MPQTVTAKLIESHLVDGRMNPGEEIGLKIDQTLTQDATGSGQTMIPMIDPVSRGCAENPTPSRDAPRPSRSLAVP